MKNFIVCRNEPFGGIIFNQNNGNSYKVDKELFDTFLKFHAGKEIRDEKLLITLKSMSSGCKEIKFLEKKGIQDSEKLEILTSPEIISFSITNYCEKGCEFCYSNSTPSGTFFDMKNLPLLIQELQNNRVLQVTIGGGEPTSHPHLKDLLKAIREAGTIPNVTTNGINLNQNILKIIKEYSSALAFSYDCSSKEIINKWIQEAIKMGIECHVHYIVSKNNLSTILEDLNEVISFSIKRLTLLLFKALGRGKKLKSRCLTEKDIPLLKEKILRLILLSSKHNFQLTFDDSFIPYLIQSSVIMHPVFSDYCTAGRYSCSLNQDFLVKPCSMMQEGGISLKNLSLAEIWNSKLFMEFREKVMAPKKGCEVCKSLSLCHGGCPLIEKCLYERETKI